MEQTMVAASAQKSSCHSRAAAATVQTSFGHPVWAAAQRTLKLPAAAFHEIGLPFAPRTWGWAMDAPCHGGQGTPAVVHEENHAGLTQDEPAGS